mmetsp:Transcript_62786/g.166626  ORF Transcript_62786/g.166626 Transcript_62786/m.166626 type:complete len:310 (+) Transcript_62786:302-1231(+)
MRSAWSENGSGLEFLQHLLLELRLVGLDVTLPLLHGPLVAEPDLLCNLSNESEVVGDQDQASLELVDGVRQRIDALHVQVIRWLIEEQNVGIHERYQQHYDTRPHAVGHRLHLSRLELSRDAEASQLSAPLRLFQLSHATGGHDALRIKILQELERNLLEIKYLLTVLMVVSDAEFTVALHLAHSGLNLGEHELQQCGFSGTIGAHEGNTRIKVDSKLQILIQVILLLTRVGEGHITECEDGRRDVLRVGEREIVRHIHFRFLCKPSLLHFIDDLLLGLCLLPHVGVGTTRTDEIQQMCDVILLLLVLC